MKMALGAIGNPSASMKHEAHRGGERVPVARGALESGAALLCASVFGNGLNYLLMLFLARQVGAADFWRYALGLAISKALLLVAIAGVDTGAIEFVPGRSCVRTGRGLTPCGSNRGGFRDGSWLDRRARPAALGDSLSVRLYGKPGPATALR